MFNLLSSLNILVIDSIEAYHVLKIDVYKRIICIKTITVFVLFAMEGLANIIKCSFARLGIRRPIVRLFAFKNLVDLTF